MSAINSFGTEKIWSKVLGDWALVQLVDVRGEYEVGFGEHDRIMKDGFYGLTLSNDPAFIFEFRPLPKYSDEELDSLPSDAVHQYFDALDYWIGQFEVAYFSDHYFLLKACESYGYDLEEDGYSIGAWVGEFLTPIIENLREPDHISIYE